MIVILERGRALTFCRAHRASLLGSGLCGSRSVAVACGSSVAVASSRKHVGAFFGVRVPVYCLASTNWYAKHYECTMSRPASAE